MRRLFRKQPNPFIDLLSQQSELTLRGMEGLIVYMNGHDAGVARQVTDIEKEADEVRRILIAELNRTFVTPSTVRISLRCRAPLTTFWTTRTAPVVEMEILKVQATSYMHRIATLLRDAAYELNLAVQRLEKHPIVANDHAQRAKALENRVEDVYREAIAALFSGPEDVQHVVDMLKQREVYRHLSNAADRGDQAANVICDIVVKMT
jgi:uncharacterized protein Yka (UPF0111/DUF47 family)